MLAPRLLRRTIAAVLLPLLLVLTAYSMTLAVRHGLYAAWGGGDLHAYWYHAHYVREGRDPYHRRGRPEDLRLPLRYLDGVTIERGPLFQPGLSRTLGSTATALLIATPTAWLSWSTARLVWLIFNLVCTAATPWLLLRIVRSLGPERWLAGLLVAFGFYALYPTRIAIEMGQTTPMVLLSMIGALAVPNTAVAGLLLGVSLGKYSLSLPVIPLLLLSRRFGVVAIGILVQAAAFMFVASLDGGSLLGTLRAHIDAARGHAAQSGMHLAARFDAGDPGGPIAVGFLVLSVLGPLAFWAHGRRLWTRPPTATEQLHLLNVLGLLALLVVYHRGYDAALFLIFIATAIQGLMGDRDVRLPPADRLGLGILLLALAPLAIQPSLATRVVARTGAAPALAAWMQSTDNLFCAVALVALAASLWMLYRLPSPQASGQRALRRGDGKRQSVCSEA